MRKNSKRRREHWKFRGVVLEVTGRYYRWTCRRDVYLWYVDDYKERTIGK